MLEKFVLTILEFNWNQRLGHRKTKLNICHHRLTSSTELQNRSFDVVERTRTSSKCQKLKNARAKRAKILFSIVKYANLSGFCCRRRRGCLSSLIALTLFSEGSTPLLLNTRPIKSPSESCKICTFLHSKWGSSLSASARLAAVSRRALWCLFHDVIGDVGNTLTAW